MAIPIQVVARGGKGGLIRRSRRHAEQFKARRTFQLIDDLFLLRFIAVQLKARISQTNLVETLLDHVERSLFLRNKEHLFIVCKRLCDEVDDGLGFTCPWWPLNYHVCAASNIQECESLCAISVHNMETLFSVQMVVKKRTIRKNRTITSK